VRLWTPAAQQLGTAADGEGETVQVAEARRVFELLRSYDANGDGYIDRGLPPPAPPLNFRALRLLSPPATILCSPAGLSQITYLLTIDRLAAGEMKLYLQGLGIWGSEPTYTDGRRPRPRIAVASPSL
jgi:hypothetical protein